MNVWRADEGRFAPELAGSFAILSPGDPFAPIARQYALAFEVLRPFAKDAAAMNAFESRLEGAGVLKSIWPVAQNVFEALQAFQRKRGEEPTGILTKAQVDALMGPVASPLPSDLPAGDALTVIDPLRDPGATPEQRLIGASFMRFYGFFVEARPDGLYVTGLAPKSPFSGKLSKGDKLIAANGDKVSTIPQFVAAAAKNAVPQRKDNVFRFTRQSVEFELPLVAPTDSTWNFDVAHAFLFFDKGFAAVQDEMWAPTYDRIFYQIGANFALADPQDPAAGDAAKLALVFAALDDVGLSSGQKDLMVERLMQRKLLPEPLPTSSQLAAAIEGYQKFLGQPVTGLLTKAQLDSLIESKTSNAMVDEIAKLLSDNALDPALAQAVLDRAIIVYQQVLSKWDSPQPTEVLLSLQQHYGLPETGHADMDLIGMIAREQVRLPPGTPDPLQVAFAKIGDVSGALSAALEKAGVDKALTPQLLKRIEFAYRQALGGPAGASTSKMVEALKERYGIPKDATIDVKFLKQVLSEKVVLPDEGGDEAYTKTGDWTYIKTERLCVLATSVFDTRNIDGAFLHDGPPRAAIHYTPSPKSASLAFFIGSKELFAPGSPVFVISGGAKVAVVPNAGGGYAEKPQANGTVTGILSKMFARSSNFVTLTGKSPFGGTLSVRFSAKGFSKAFKAVNDQCAEGRLSAWVR